MVRILSANLHNRKKKMQKPTASPLPPSLEEIDAAPLQHWGMFTGIVGQQKSDLAQPDVAVGRKNTGPGGRPFGIGIKMGAYTQRRP
jgi:hypothetical protein